MSAPNNCLAHVPGSPTVFVTQQLPLPDKAGGAVFIRTDVLVKNLVRGIELELDKYGRRLGVVEVLLNGDAYQVVVRFAPPLPSYTFVVTGKGRGGLVRRVCARTLSVCKSFNRIPDPIKTK